MRSRRTDYVRQGDGMSCLLPERSEQIGRCHIRRNLSLFIIGIVVDMSHGIGQCASTRLDGYEYACYLQGYQGAGSVCHSYWCGNYGFGSEFEYYHECFDSACWTWCYSVGADVSTHPRSQHWYHHHRTPRCPRLRQCRSTPSRSCTPLLQPHRHPHLVPHPLHAQCPTQRCTRTRKVDSPLTLRPTHLHHHRVLRHSPSIIGIVGIVPARIGWIYRSGSPSCCICRVCHCTHRMVVAKTRGKREVFVVSR
mmetsp:Transcript_5129/g.11651  ORF Transcript_5129/g.11651 Transcript_5129/m.11651 type:complete len:251 (+) Transcript_5129:944-1696(+)